MATNFTPKHISSPQLLEHVTPQVLLRFLKKYKEYFTAEGVMPTSADDIDYDRLSLVLASPNEVMPAYLMADLFYWDEVAEMADIEDLNEIAARQGIEFGDEVTIEEAVLLVRMHAPDDLEDLYDVYQAHGLLRKKKRFLSYFAKVDDLPEWKKPTPKKMSQFAAEMDGWYADQKKGRGTRVSVIEKDDAAWFIVRHGGTFKRENAVENGEPKLVFYRPEAYDLLITVITTVVAVLKVLGAVLAFLVSPIGLVIAAVAALAGYLIYATDIGAKSLQWLGSRFQVLKEDALAAYQGIADALAAGDIALAAKVLWLTLKMEWTRGVNFLEKVWLNFRNFFIRIGYDAFHGLLAVVEIVWHALEVGWIESVAVFKKLWSNLVGFFSRLWQNMVAIARKAWQWIKGLFSESARQSSDNVNARIDAERDVAINRINDAGERDRARAEAERQRRRDRAASQHEATLAEIERQNLQKHSELDAEYERRMAENEEDLEQARKEWQDAIDEARNKREARERDDSGPEGLQSADDVIDKARDALAGLGDIGDLVEQEAAKIGVRGTFNAAAIQGLVSGSAADRTAKATEETAKNTKKLVTAAQTGGLTFA